jgi:hypothetical protein
VKDVALAEGLLVRACERGDGRGCGALASLLRERDPTRALTAADRGCELWDREACIFAAQSYEEGEGTRADLRRAELSEARRPVRARGWRSTRRLEAGSLYADGCRCLDEQAPLL